MIENILAVVGDEEIVPTVVIVIADANPLSPTGVSEPGPGSDIGESAVTIVAEKMRRGFATCGKALEAPAVHDKNVEPAVVVVIVKRNATTGSFE